MFTFKNTEKMKIFYSTLINACYMSSDNDAIIVGSGNSPCIYLNKNFVSGISGKSETFNNAVLSGTEHFQILEIEVWGLV